MGKKILIVDDEPLFVKLVSQVLGHHGFEVLTANDGQEALRTIYGNKPDPVLLDVIMPRLDGWQTCSRIREVSDVPVIMLTGCQKSEDDVVRGLNYGADDYLIKPVGNKELVSRVQAVLRRSEMSRSQDNQKSLVYSDGHLMVDVTAHSVSIQGEKIKLTPIEFRLFAVLLENSGRILTHKQLLEKVWGWEYVDDLDYVRIYISHLRQKIEVDGANPRYIMTEPGVGYYFQKVVPN